MKLYLVLLLLPHLTTSIWLPFVNLDSMFATLKEAAFGETMQEPEEDEPPFVSYAKVGLDFVSQLKKMFTGKMSGEDSKKLANGIRMIFNVTTTEAPVTRFVPHIITVAPANVPIQKFTFPYTRPYFPRTDVFTTLTTNKIFTTTSKPSTTTVAPTTRTTTRPPTTTVKLTTERTTLESIPIPRATTYSPIKIWPTTRLTTPSTTTTWVVPTTPRKITWKHVRPTASDITTTPMTTTEEELIVETSTRDNVPAIIKERRLTRPLSRTTTTGPLSTVSSNMVHEVCKPGSRCTISLRSFETSDAVLQYAYSHSTNIDDTLQSLLRDTQATTYPAPLSWSESVTPEVVQLAQSVMTVYRPSRCLVVGIFTGLGLLGIAEYVDSRGIVVGLEHPEFSHFWENVGLKHAKKLSMGHISRIQVRSAEEIERALPRLAASDPNTFDFIFVDDFKRTNYMDDYEHAIRLLRSGGLLMINRAFNGGGVLSGAEYMTPEDKVVRDMNLRIKQDGRVRATLLPHGDGTWLIAKK